MVVGGWWLVVGGWWLVGLQLLRGRGRWGWGGGDPGQQYKQTRKAGQLFWL
jgi:hypothetical protein